MKKILGGVAIVIMASGAVFAATEPTVDELIAQILQDGTTPVETQTAVPVATPTTTTTPAPTTGAAAVPSATDISQNQEFLDALAWMYQKGLTSFSTPATYETMGMMTRQQAAKFFVGYYETILGKKDVLYTQGCTFTDAGFDSTLLPFVQKACGYGIMKGSKEKFRPNDLITRPEFMAALIRMVEGKSRDESKNPRWIDYYTQARDYAITKEKNASAFDGKIRRYEGALYLYRAVAVSHAAEPAQTSTSATGATTTGEQGGSAAPATSNSMTTPSLTTLIADPALQEAVYWMRDNGITKYSSVEQYRPFDSVSRQEAAKIFLAYRKATIDGTPTLAEGCVFTDLEKADVSLLSSIKSACQYGLMKGNSGQFNPEGLLSKPQAVALLLRMIDSPIDESMNPWWQGYYDRAIQLGMIGESSSTNFDKPITRYEVAMLLYNSKIKTTLVRNLNNNYETNKLIYPVPNSLSSGAVTGELVGLVSINTNVLNQNNTDAYVIDLFGDQYKLERIATQKYLSNDYVWYGSVLSLDETKKVGTSAFTMSNGVLVEGVIRPYEVSSARYIITPSSQQPYYDMKMKQ